MILSLTTAVSKTVAKNNTKTDRKVLKRGSRRTFSKYADNKQK